MDITPSLSDDSSLYYHLLSTTLHQFGVMGVDFSVIPWWEWLSIFICLLFSGIYSASETAITSLSPAKVRQLVESDGEKYRLLKIWLDKPNRILTTILVGNNFVNILASSIATDITHTLFKNKGVAIAVGVMTLLILIWGEIIPKSVAKYHNQKVAIFTLPILKISYVLFYPATWVLVKLTTWIVKMFGGDFKHSGPFITEAEIEYMLNLGTEEGVFDKERKELIQSILEFDDITIKEIMVPRIKMLALSYDATPQEVLKLANSSPHSRIPVYKGHLDDIVGILYLRDLFRMYTEDGLRLTKNWTDLLRPAYFVPATMKISTLLTEFKKRKKHIAIVVDEFGGTMGLVTMEDVLEEIVGDIQDEFDQDEGRQLEKVGDKYIADASINLRDLEDYLQVEFPDTGEYDTLGGFVTALFGRVPEPKESISWKDYRFTILESTAKRVIRIQIEPPSKSKEKPGDNSSRLPERKPRESLPPSKKTDSSAPAPAPCSGEEN